MKIDLPPEKQVSHLTLLRQPRLISTTEFNALSFKERLQIVSAQEGKQKYQLIFEAKDSERIVASLASQDLLLLAKDLGFRDFSDILGMVTPEQFTNFLDLDCWERDHFNPASALEWLEALLEGAEADQAFGLLKGMDRALLTLIVKNLLGLLEEKAADSEGSDDEEAEEGENPEAFKTAEAVLKLLQSNDPQLFHELFFAAVSECESSLEEEVYQFQQGRLLDQGFCDYWEARKIYLYLDPDRFVLKGGNKTATGYPVEKSPPGFVIRSKDDKSFLGLLENEGPEVPMWEMAFLVNKVLVADGLAFGDSEQVRSVLTEIGDYLSIGRLFILKNHNPGAVSLDPDLSLETLFRLGFSLTLRLGRRAKELEKTAIGPFLDGPFHEFIKCLTQAKPRFYLGIENNCNSGNRRFVSLEDICRAEQWLGRVETQRRLFEDHFGFDLSFFTPPEGPNQPASELEKVTLSDIFLTALANRLLGRKFFPGPLSPEELPVLHQQVSSEGNLTPEFREKTVAWLESLEPGGGNFADFCLEVWAEEFCPVKPDALSPDHIGGLLIAGC